MNFNRLPGPRPSLIQRIAAGIVGCVLIVSLFFVGLFAWVLLAGFALVAGVALSIWVWRQKRRLARFRAAHEKTLREQTGQSRRQSDQIIEGEFIVTSERTRRDERGR